MSSPELSTLEAYVLLVDRGGGVPLLSLENQTVGVGGGGEGRGGGRAGRGGGGEGEEVVYEGEEVASF